jgi:hypothetical protein
MLVLTAALCLLGMRPLPCVPGTPSPILAVSNGGEETVSAFAGAWKEVDGKGVLFFGPKLCISHAAGYQSLYIMVWGKAKRAARTRTTEEPWRAVGSSRGSS